MKQVKILSALSLLAAAGAANAGVSSTWTLTNDYDFRGISQTAKDPAIQASLDYAHDSGAYAGLWFSNVKFADSGYKGDLERDIYAGFSSKIGEDLTYDVGIVDYTYNQHLYDFYEVYASLAYGPIKGKVYYAPDFGGDTTVKANGKNENTAAYAATVDATIPLPANFSILGHVGYSSGEYFTKYWDSPGSNVNYTYVDYSAGVGYAAGKFNLALKYVDTNATAKKGNLVTSDIFNNENRIVFTVATTFPW
jgi:uncharacterized protein (TIGR02001 family)